MNDKDPGGTKSTILLTLVSALVIVVGLQAWYMAGMKQQLDELREQAAAQAEPDVRAEKPAVTAPSTRPSLQATQPPVTNLPEAQPRSPFDNDWFNRPFDAGTWDPYQEIQRMQQEMDQMFNEAFGRFNRSPGFQHLYRDRSYKPDIDLKDEGDKYIAMIDLPGTQEGDLTVTLENQVLTVSGKQNYEEQNTDSFGNTIFRERRSGTFRRSITLPQPVRESGMKTELDNGVLKITIPKAG